MTLTSTDHPSMSTTVKQMSLLSTNNGEENQSSCSQDIRQHAECNLPGKTIRLPNELMALIFSFLTNSQSTLYACTLTNKVCYDLANPMLWKAPDFVDQDHAMRFQDGMLATTDARRHMLGRLIHDVRPMTWCKETLSRLLLHMPHLQHLTLAYGDGTILHQLSNLTTLKLDEVDVTEAEFDTLAQWPLEALDWTLKSRQNIDWLTRLARCPMRRLSINCATSLIRQSPFDVQRLREIENTAAAIAEFLTNPFTTFLANPTTFPQLTYLRVDQAADIHDLMLIAFFNNHPLLEELHLTHQYVTDASLDAMGVLSRLTRLSLKLMLEITSPAVRRLINACPLTYLDVTDCRQLLDSDFPELGWETIGVWDQHLLDNIRHQQW